MATLAVVALGLVALAAPAGASAKTSKQTRADIKRLGENVNELRKKTDEMNRTISSLATVAGDSLTKLQAGLIQLSDTTANFKYAAVQVAGVGGAAGGITGVGPTHFFVTPPILPTGAQSSVTFPIPDFAVAVGAGLVPNSNLRLNVAIRSLKPDTGSVQCRVTIGRNSGALTSTWATWRRGTTDGLFVPMPQSRITPENGNSRFPVELVATEDNVLDLADPDYMATNLSIIQAGAGLGSVVQQRADTTGGLTATLSCLRAS